MTISKSATGRSKYSDSLCCKDFGLIINYLRYGMHFSLRLLIIANFVKIFDQGTFFSTDVIGDTFTRQIYYRMG
jgi:hypothetical protein